MKTLDKVLKFLTEGFSIDYEIIEGNGNKMYHFVDDAGLINLTNTIGIHNALLKNVNNTEEKNQSSITMLQCDGVYMLFQYFYNYKDPNDNGFALDIYDENIEEITHILIKDIGITKQETKEFVLSCKSRKALLTLINDYVGS